MQYAGVIIIEQRPENIKISHVVCNDGESREEHHEAAVDYHLFRIHRPYLWDEFVLVTTCMCLDEDL